MIKLRLASLQLDRQPMMGFVNAGVTLGVSCVRLTLHQRDPPAAHVITLSLEF